MSDRSWQNQSPGDLSISLPRVTPTPVGPALAGAQGAARSWAKTPLPERMALLQAVEADLAAIREELAMGIAVETGKPLTEARGELGAVLGKFALTFRDAGDYIATRTTEGGPYEAQVRHLARGPAVVIGPFNFPLHLANGAIVPHLLAGNPVLFKPSPVGAVVAARYAAVFSQHLPAGVFQLVQGGAEEGMALCQAPCVRNICFTGSVKAGQAIAKALAGDFTKDLALEMGGKNALILLDDGDPAAAARAAADGMCATAGQRCNDTSRAIIHRNHATAFTSALIEELKRYQPGDPCDAATTLGVLATRPAHQRYAAALAADAGDGWLQTGTALDSCGGRRGYYVTPAVRLWNSFDRAMQCPLIAEELFAPLLDVFVVDDEEQMLALHDAAPYGLAASIFTSSRAHFEAFGSDLRVGNLYANLPTTYSPSILPFGGCGLSGNGRPAGRGFIRFTTDEQAVQFGPGLRAC